MRLSVVRVVTESGQGSGVVVRGDAVLTAAHVVRGALEVRVVAQDSQVLQGFVAGRDNNLDLAVIRVATPRPLTAARLGFSVGPRDGDDVFALGYPLGAQLVGGATTTTGIVSAAQRGPYVQTSAAINAGSSGGPLVNRSGAVIGINTGKVEQSEGRPVEGIGFAIRLAGLEPEIARLLSGQKADPTPRTLAAGQKWRSSAPLQRGDRFRGTFSAGPGVRWSLRDPFGDLLVESLNVPVASASWDVPVTAAGGYVLELDNSASPVPSQLEVSARIES